MFALYTYNLLIRAKRRASLGMAEEKGSINILGVSCIVIKVLTIVD